MGFARIGGGSLVDNRLRFGHVLLGGFLAELALVVVVMIVRLLLGEEAVTAVAGPGSFLTAGFFGYWVGHKVGGRRVLHGTLVGVVAMLIYLPLPYLAGATGPQPPEYMIAHALKIIGGALGGFLAHKFAER
jgi:putative membrane protein (TIGR04086 family)